MNFSVHFDEATVTQLSAAVTRVGLTRNRIIATAVQEWLARNAEKDWPPALQQHFRNPAPELAQESLDTEGWRAALATEAGANW